MEEKVDHTTDETVIGEGAGVYDVTSFDSSMKERHLAEKILQHLNNIRCDYGMVQGVLDGLDALEAGGVSVNASRPDVEGQLHSIKQRLMDLTVKFEELEKELSRFASEIKPPRNMPDINFHYYEEQYQYIPCPIDSCEDAGSPDMPFEEDFMEDMPDDFSEYHDKPIEETDVEGMETVVGEAKEDMNEDVTT